ncbi:MAG TPA: hypothetical protein VK806_12535 [Bacteroidia bacterium]|jgi:hypothetical protein|nr:hypothetical protein [Bacteroidia bacterium]
MKKINILLVLSILICNVAKIIAADTLKATVSFSTPDKKTIACKWTLNNDQAPPSITLSRDTIVCAVINDCNKPLTIRILAMDTIHDTLLNLSVSGPATTFLMIKQRSISLAGNSITAKLRPAFGVQFFLTANKKSGTSSLLCSFAAKSTVAKVKGKYTGIELLDAITLQHYIKTDTCDDMIVYNLVGKYASRTFTKFKDAIGFYRDTAHNKFMADILTKLSLLKVHKDVASAQSYVSDELANAETALGNTDVASISDAVAQVIVAQFKEDLTEIFFTKFQKKISAPEFTDVWLLLPHTKSLLSDIGKDIYNYKKYLTDIRAAFKLDLNSVFANLPNVINEGTFATYFVTHEDYKAAALSAIYLGDSLMNKHQPGGIIEHFPQSILDTLAKVIDSKDSVKVFEPTKHDSVKKTIKRETYQNVISAVNIVKLISKSLRGPSNAKYWVNADTLTLLKNENVRNAYLGLLYQGAKGIVFRINGKIDSLQGIINEMDTVTKMADKFIAYINQLGKLSANVDKTSKELSSKTNSDKVLATADFYNSIVTLIDSAVDIGQLPGLDKLNMSAIKPYIKVLNDGSAIAADISKSEYLLIPTKLLDICRVLNLGDEKKAKGFIKYLNKYGDFIGMMVDAQNPDAIKQALQNSMTASGGSVTKQKCGLNIAVNSYIGGARSWSDKATTNSVVVNSLAVTAPIGISVSHGFNSNVIGAITIFGSIVDIGAFAAFRLNDDSTKTQTLPKTTLANIFAPGIHIILGRLGNTPLSIAVGYQMAPRLRSLTATNADVVTNNVWQEQIALTWDIPLINICSVKKTNQQQ